MKNNMDLTKGNLFTIIWKLSLPIMFSNFLQTLYNLTDTFWLGKLGENAKDAVAVAGLAFPIIFFLSSFGAGFTVAATALISRYKGAGNDEKIRKLLTHFVMVGSVFIFIYFIIALFFIDNILVWLNTPEEIFSIAKLYLRLILFGGIFMFITIFYQSVAQGLGDSMTPMIAQLVSIFFNLILDPILIFGFLGFTKMGVLGAAIATFISRVLATIISIYFFFKKDKIFIPKKSDWRIDFSIFKTILKLSMPASLSQSMTSFGFLFLQSFVNSYGTVAISVYSIGSRITGFFMMPAMGISNALAAIVGQNLGKGDIKRVEQSFKISLRLVMSIMFVGGVFIWFFGAEVVKFFINDKDVIAAGIRMFKITAFASFIFGFIFMFMGLFNGSGHTGYVFSFNVSRLWLFRIPLVYILSGKVLNFLSDKSSFIYHFIYKLSQPLSAFPYDALWWSMLVSNILSASMAFFIYLSGKWKIVKE